MLIPKALTIRNFKTRLLPLVILCLGLCTFFATKARSQSVSVTFTYTGAMQTFTIPPLCTNTISIEAFGAVGGNNGGVGADIRGTFVVTPGQVLSILVGGQGTVASSERASGGGGSFVADALNNPMIVAGGGGGRAVSGFSTGVFMNANAVGTSGFDGYSAQNGQVATVSWYGIGGTLGNGATNGLPALGNPHAGNGGGFYTNGANGMCGGGGAAFVNGGAGGALCSGATPGGFGGGGGGGYWGAGGGGGYSGGGGSYHAPSNGGGGGSFNGGTNQLNQLAGPGNGTVIISYNPGVGIVATPPALCVGSGNTTLTASGAITYTWNTGSNSNSIVVSPTITTTYTVASTAIMTCPNAAITVTVNPLPVIGITSSVSGNCNGASVSFTANGASVYTWQPGGVTGSLVTLAPAANTIYTVTGVDVNGCTNTALYSQTVVPTVSISVGSATLSACQSSVYTISAGGASNYTWYPGPVTGSTYTNFATANTTHTVIGTTTSGCTGTAVVSISVLPTPTLAFQTTSITCASLGSATVSATGGTGPYSYTWSPTGQTSSVVTGLSPGVYTLAVQDMGTGCMSVGTTTFSSLIPLAGTLNNTSSVSCYGATTGTANYSNITGGSFSQVYNWTNGTTVLTTQTVGGLGAGNWSVTVTDALTGCVINNNFVITQPPALTLTMASPSPTLCAGSSMLLSGILSGGTPAYTYSWSGGPAFNSYFVSSPLAGTYVYSLTGRDSYSCSVMNTISLNFIANPVLTMTPVSTCPLATGTLNVSGATSYTWGNGTSGNTFTANPAITTQYSVTGAALGCSSTAAANIVVMAAPVVTLGYNGPVCNADNLFLTAMGGSLYSWQGPASFSSAVQNPFILSAVLANAGIYNVTVTAVNGCTATAFQNVVVNPTPTISVAGSTVCSGSALSLFANSFPGAGYQWNGPAAITSNLQNPVFPNIGLTATGIYSLLVTSVPGCTNTATVTAVVVPPPQTAGGLSAYAVCAQNFNGSPISASLSLSGATSYMVSGPPHVVISNVTSPNSVISVTYPYTPGPTSLLVAGSNGVCTVTNTVIFTILANPGVSITTASGQICAGQSYTLSAGGADFYSWGPPGSGIVSQGGVNQTVVVTPTVSTLYSVYGSSVGCNSPPVFTTVNVKPIPTISVTSGVSVCVNNTVGLSVQGNGTSYIWSPSAGLSSTVGMNVVSNTTSNQTYTITTSLNSCTSQAVVSVSVHALPSPTIVFSKPGVCLNDTITIKGYGAASYVWTGPNAFARVGVVQVLAAANPSYAGTYSLQVVDSLGCKGSARASLTVYELPKGSFAGDITKSCIPYCSAFKFKTGPSVISAWTYEDQSFSGNTFSTCIVNYGENVFSGTLKDTVIGCSSKQSYTIQGWPRPSADFYFSPENPVEKIDEVNFNAVVDDGGLNQFKWYFIRNDGFTHEGVNASYFFPFSGVQRVAMVTTNKFGCSDTAVKLVTVTADFNVYVPQAFTPNKDGLNDVFMPVGAGIKSYEMNIYNRWGTRLFTSNDPQKGWDGNFNQEACQDGVYIWTILVTGLKDELKTLNGTVTLSR